MSSEGVLVPSTSNSETKQHSLPLPQTKSGDGFGLKVVPYDYGDMSRSLHPLINGFCSPYQ